ncbi:MAG: ADP-ribosylglycohydrolase family protein [Armatimonadota bacterium]
MKYKNTQLYDKILAGGIGLAAGNALGNPVKGENWQSAGGRQGRSPQFLSWSDTAEPARTYVPGEVDSVAALALGAAGRAGDERLPLTGTVLFDELMRAHQRSGFLSSLPISLAVARGVQPGDACVSAVSELAGPEAVIIGLTFGLAYAGDPARAALEARSACSLLLSGPSLQAGQIAAAAMASAFLQNATASTVLQSALDFSPPPISRLMQPAVLFAREHQGHPLSRLIPLMHDRFSVPANGAHGAVVESLVVALVCLYISDGQVETAVSASVSYGGWAQALGAVACAIAGALTGVSGIPAEWKKAVTSANPHVQFDALAEGLCGLVVSDCERQSLRVEYLSSLARKLE